MFARKKMPNSKLNEVSRQATLQLNKLLTDSTDASLKLRALRNVRRLLDCMVMGTYQYDVSVARINNAERYLNSGEPGAAKFEIRMLFGRLQREVFDDQPLCETVEPVRAKGPRILAAVKSTSPKFEMPTFD